MNGCKHVRWRRWRITRLVLSHLYCSGITSNGGGMSWGGGCNGCNRLPGWRALRGRRFYVLWIRTDHWRCLIRGHHIPGEEVAFGLCGKCLPCPECGSKRVGHFDTCPAIA